MGTGDLSTSDYDRYADAYLASVTRREQGEAGDSYGILPHLLDLIDAAREKDPDNAIDYRVADLSRPLPDDAGRFDIVASYLALNDVAEYRGFIATLAASLRPGGRMVIALNNPYGAVIRRHVADYFESGAVRPYPGLWSAGIRTYYHHRTLQDYLDAFLGSGLSLTKLADIPAMASVSEPKTILPEGGRFPRFMLLRFTRM
ncbi:MAG TPA: methyltransferase domain-containing protein [Trebonia sp.]